MSESHASPIGTFLVARNDMSRLGLIALIEESDSLHLAGEARTAEDALRILAKQTFDVAVIEQELPGMLGMDLTAALRSRGFTTPVLLISEQTSGDLTMKALASGAVGYMTGSAEPAEIVAAICSVAQGRSVLGRDVGAALIPELQRRTHSGSGLTDREIDILRELSNGGTAQEIGVRMHLAVPTVKNHISHLYAKLGVRDRGAAVAEAMRQGWLK